MHAAVLGDPVAHSLSPVLHTAAYRALGLTGWHYHAVSCPESDLAALLGRVRRSRMWAGLSLTMPLKQVAVRHLDDLHARVEAINTIVVTDGHLAGYNTDVDGVRAGLQDLGYDGGPAAVVGAGGTARAALAALAGLGASTVTVHVRDPQRAAAAARVGTAHGLRVRVTGLDEMPVGNAVISTLPATAPAVATCGPLLDVVYAPWPTPTAAAAQAAGQRVLGGHVVLLGQAAAQVTLMTGRPAPIAAMAAALSAASS